MLYYDTHKSSFNPSFFEECEAFRNLVGMGVGILPYVHQAVTYHEIGTSLISGWSGLIQKIVGETDYDIPSEIKNKANLMRVHVKDWLEQRGTVLDETLDAKTFREDLQGKYDLVKPI